jgi:hypothetical protein
MSGKLLGLVAAAALLVSIGAASAKEPLKLTEVQLDKVTAGADVTNFARNTTFVSNGRTGGGGVSQFSPATTAVTPTITNVGLGLFNIN